MTAMSPEGRPAASVSAPDARLMPIQKSHHRVQSVIPAAVYLLAYEVYCEVCGPQPQIVTGNCRGGFGVDELTAFLYAHSFPRHEWRARVEEAHKGMVL